MSERSFNMQVKECAISFVVPVTKILCHTRGLVKTLGKTFISLRDRSNQYEDKVEFDRLRVIFEYADKHGATWCELAPSGTSAIVTVYFSDITAMMKFKEGVEEVVKNNAMK